MTGDDDQNAEEIDIEGDLLDSLSDDENAVRAQIIRLARSEGVAAAYKSALRICNDPKAPMQAQAHASRTLLQIGGLLERADRAGDRGDEKDLSEMTGQELAAAIERAQARVRSIEAGQKRRPRKKTETVFD